MNIICLAFPAWEGNYLKSTVQLMTELARTEQVMYVDYAYTFKDMLQSMRGKGFANWRRMLGIVPRLRTVNLENGSTLHVLTLPPTLPVNFIKNPKIYDFLMRINAFFVKKAIQKATRQLGFSEYTVVNAFNPFLGVPLAKKLGENRLVYYCYDEIGAATWASQHGSRLENTFVPLCDAVIYSSQGLFDKKAHRNPNSFLVKNAVDFDLFSRKIAPENLPIIENRHKEQKIIGYLGSIDERVDYDLLEALFRYLPQHLFVFVGRIPQAHVAERLAAFPNVRCVGAQPPAKLPAWVQVFDVCLIPFLKNALTAGIYPLKGNEYLAAGKPVVATRFADLSDFEKIIGIADDTEGYLNLVKKTLDNDTDAQQTERRDFAAQNSWKARAEAMKNVLSY